MNYLASYSALHLILAKYDVTQETFAHDIGVTVSTISRWATGKNKPSRLAQKRIDAVLRRYARAEKRAARHA